MARERFEDFEDVEDLGLRHLLQRQALEQDRFLKEMDDFAIASGRNRAIRGNPGGLAAHLDTNYIAVNGADDGNGGNFAYNGFAERLRLLNERHRDEREVDFLDGPYQDVIDAATDRAAELAAKVTLAHNEQIASVRQSGVLSSNYLILNHEELDEYKDRARKVSRTDAALPANVIASRQDDELALHQLLERQQLELDESDDKLDTLRAQRIAFDNDINNRIRRHGNLPNHSDTHPAAMRELRSQFHAHHNKQLAAIDEGQDPIAFLDSDSEALKKLKGNLGKTPAPKKEPGPKKEPEPEPEPESEEKTEREERKLKSNKAYNITDSVASLPVVGGGVLGIGAAGIAAAFVTGPGAIVFGIIAALLFVAIIAYVAKEYFAHTNPLRDQKKVEEGLEKDGPSKGKTREKELDDVFLNQFEGKDREKAKDYLKSVKAGAHYQDMGDHGKANFMRNLMTISDPANLAYFNRNFSGRPDGAGLDFHNPLTIKGMNAYLAVGVKADPAQQNEKSLRWVEFVERENENSKTLSHMPSKHYIPQITTAFQEGRFSDRMARLISVETDRINHSNLSESQMQKERAKYETIAGILGISEDPRIETVKNEFARLVDSDPAVATLKGNFDYAKDVAKLNKQSINGNAIGDEAWRAARTPAAVTAEENKRVAAAVAALPAGSDQNAIDAASTRARNAFDANARDAFRDAAGNAARHAAVRAAALDSSPTAIKERARLDYLAVPRAAGDTRTDDERTTASEKAAKAAINPERAREFARAEYDRTHNAPDRNAYQDPAAYKADKEAYETNHAEPRRDAGNNAAKAVWDKYPALAAQETPVSMKPKYDSEYKNAAQEALNNGLANDERLVKNAENTLSTARDTVIKAAMDAVVAQPKGRDGHINAAALATGGAHPNPIAHKLVEGANANITLQQNREREKEANRNPNDRGRDNSINGPDNSPDARRRGGMGGRGGRDE
jgi:hypothetical protein